jgi:hypothetical protein
MQDMVHGPTAGSTTLQDGRRVPTRWAFEQVGGRAGATPLWVLPRRKGGRGDAATPTTMRAHQHRPLVQMLVGGGGLLLWGHVMEVALSPLDAYTAADRVGCPGRCFPPAQHTLFGLHDWDAMDADGADGRQLTPS